MENRDTWCSAFGFSLALHVLLIVGIGWYVSHHALQAEEMESFMELELVSDYPPLPGQETAVQSKPIIQQVVQQRPEPINSQKSQTVAETLEVVSAELQKASVAVVANNPASIAAGSLVSSANGTSQSRGEGQRNSHVFPPRILKKIEPAFPERARRAGIEGTVVVKMTILENGHPDNVRVWESSGREDMDQSAVEAVERWRFVPARDQRTGREVSCITMVPVAFRLQS